MIWWSCLSHSSTSVLECDTVVQLKLIGERIHWNLNIDIRNVGHWLTQKRHFGLTKTLCQGKMKKLWSIARLAWLPHPDSEESLPPFFKSHGQTWSVSTLDCPYSTSPAALQREWTCCAESLNAAANEPRDLYEADWNFVLLYVNSIPSMIDVWQMPPWGVDSYRCACKLLYNRNA